VGYGFQNDLTLLISSLGFVFFAHVQHRTSRRQKRNRVLRKQPWSLSDRSCETLQEPRIHPTMHPTPSSRASQPGKTPGDGRRPKSITNGHCSHCATIEGAPCPDCGGETFRDEGRVTWCRECGWNHSPPSSWDSLSNAEIEHPGKQQ
jgi:hypothetical protein